MTSAEFSEYDVPLPSHDDDEDTPLSIGQHLRDNADIMGRAMEGELRVRG